MKRISACFLLFLFVVLSTVNVSFAQFRLDRNVNQPNGLGNIHGITTNPENDDIFISDFRNVQIFNSDWEHQGALNPNQNEVRGLGFDFDQNNLLLGHAGQNSYSVMDLEGEVLSTTNVNAYVNTIAYDSDRELYILGIWDRMVIIHDRDHEEIDRFNVECNITGIEYYPLNGTIFILDTNDPLLEYSIEGELVNRVIENDQFDGNGQDICYNANDRELYGTSQGGWIGIWEDNYGALAEPEFAPEGFDLQVPFGMAEEEILVITNIGEENSRLNFEINDVGGEPDWLDCEPAEGEIESDESVEVTLTITTAELQPGNFERTIIVYTNVPGFREVEIPVALMVIAGFGELSGTVNDAATENPVEGALINVHDFDLQAVSDENGEYVIPEIPEWVFTVSITADDYLPQTVEEIEIIEDAVTDLDFDLLHSVCELSPEEISENIPVNEEIEVPVNLANPGNGPLTWAANLVFPEGMDADPWELRVDVSAGVITEDSRVQGAVFINDHFYLSGANNRDPMIYVLNRDQELVDQYGQIGEGRYGYKDLASDGEIIWGSGERVIYGFTPEGEEVTSFESGISPCNNVAWDCDRDILWASGTTSDIVGFDRDGRQVAEISRHDLRVYGLAYWPDDPDGHQLYVFHKVNDVGDMMIAKIDIENDNAMDVVTLEHDAGGVAQGCFITNQYDYYSWVFMGVANNGAEDRVDIWHLEANTGWVGVDQMEGILESDDELEIIVSLSTLDFPVDLEFTVDLVFTHDGVGGETVLPISLTAMGDEGPEVRTIEMAFGWNMVSVNVEPEDNGIIALTQALVDEDLMEMMKNGAGQFYSPAFGFNNIPGWEVTDGYLIKTTAECELAIEGIPVAADDPIPLSQGWQMKGYYPRDPVEATLALSGIVDNLEMAKDGSGRFYSPAFGFSNMGDMMEGCGYMLKMSEAMDLIYVVEENQVAQFHVEPEQLPIVSPTSENMSLLITSNETTDLEIGVYANNILVGSGRMYDGACGIAVWGDDPTTEILDGALGGDVLDLQYLNESGGKISCDFTMVSGGGFYQRDELWVVELNQISSVPEVFGIISTFPNPFNNRMSLKYSLPEAGIVNLSVFDLTGRQMMKLASGQHEAGVHSLIVNGEVLTTGIYFIKLEASGQVSERKIVMVK